MKVAIVSKLIRSLALLLLDVATNPLLGPGASERSAVLNARLGSLVGSLEGHTGAAHALVEVSDHLARAVEHLRTVVAGYAADRGSVFIGLVVVLNLAVNRSKDVFTLS